MSPLVVTWAGLVREPMSPPEPFRARTIP